MPLDAMDNPFEKMTKDELNNFENLSPYLFEDDEVLVAQYINWIEDKGKEYKILTNVKRLIKAILKDKAKMAKQEEENLKLLPKEPQVEIANQTNFPAGFSEDFDTLQCGQWIANRDGVKKIYPNSVIEASPFPILPIMILKNVSNHVEKVVLAYFKQKEWHFQTVYRTDITSTQSIVKCGNYGMNVTSKNAPALVDYLQEIETLNEDIIPMKLSTTKMGWHGTEFMPFTDKLVFDGDHSYNDLLASIHESGNYDVWLKAVREVRATKRIEPLIFLAGSFGSPLLQLLGVQSFAIDLWGDTEGGKTICIRLATSIWADSHEGKYYGNFQSTEVGFEIKQGFLNNLPCLIDDSSNIKNKDKFSYSTFIYNRCNEKGKTRSNISRGIELENTWRQIILMTGEQPFITESAQGGAINRTLEVTCGFDPIFKDPRGFCDMLDNNYGFAGKDFLEHIQAIGVSKIRDIFNEQRKKVEALDKMKKQSNALAVLLTADILAEQFIFKDGVTIDLDKAAELLTDKSMVSENERCYEYLVSQAVISQNNFVPVENDEGEKVYKAECWGEYSEDRSRLYIIKSVFDRLCLNGGFSSRKFLDWAVKHDKIRSSDGRTTIIKWISEKTSRVRCVCLLIDSTMLDSENDLDEDTSGSDNDLMNGIPF